MEQYITKLSKIDNLNEWKNISDDVIQISEYVIASIIKDSDDKPFKYSKINKMSLIVSDDIFKLHINQNNVNQVINVKYILYNVNNDYEYDVAIKALAVNLNSEWDEDTKTLTIVGILINRQPTNKLQQSVIHEIEHMYQYFQGMKKRVNLYDKCIKLYISNNPVEKNVGVALYYTFKHEQDAYVQQFYRHLYNYNNKIDIDDVLSEYSPFIYLNEVYDFVDELREKKNEYLYKVINQLGYSTHDYFKRLHFAYSRLIKKLENAYERWCYENRDKFLSKNQKINEMLLDVSLYQKINESNIERLDKYFILEPFYQCFYK